jgi:hypothetical protein
MEREVAEARHTAKGNKAGVRNKNWFNDALRRALSA